MPSLGYRQAIVSDVRELFSKVEIYFDGANNPPAVFDDNDVISIEGLREAETADSAVGYGFVSSSEITVKLVNIERRFSPTNINSPYYGKMVPSVKLVSYIGIRLPDETVEYVKVGTFYVSQWDTDSSQFETTVTCHDRLFDLMQRDVPMLPSVSDTTIAELFRRLFVGLGLSSDEFDVGSRLRLPVKIGWFERGSVGGMLNKLAQAGSCSVIVNPDDVIEVRSAYGRAVTNINWTDENMIISARNPHKYRDVYSEVVVEYSMPYVEETEEVFRLNNFDLPNGVTRLTNLSYSSDVVSTVESVEIYGASNVIVQDFSYGAVSMDIVILNDSDPVEVDIVVRGKPITVATATVSASDAEAIAAFGRKTLNIENYLIQSVRLARTYASTFVEYVKNPLSTFNMEVRGDLSIGVNSYLTIDDQSDKISPVVVKPQRIEFEYNGSLSSTVSARLPVVPTYWTMVSPGMYILSEANILEEE